MLPGFDAMPLKREFKRLMFRVLPQFAVSLLSSQNAAQARTALGVSLGGAGSDIASAATLPLAARTGKIVRVTGVVASSATDLETGGIAICIADEKWPLTYHATNMPLPGGMDYTCEAGDVVTFIKDGSGNLTVLIDKKNGNSVNEIGELFFTVGDTAPGGSMVTNGQAVSRTVYANLHRVMNGAFSAQTFTVTIASPGVFTKTSHGFTGGERIRLSTTGALPTGLDSSTDYFVLYVSANTFRLATTYEGTAINTSGSQSGTHSYLQSVAGLGDGSTTFNLPDTRDDFTRSLGTGRTRGTRRLDAIQGHGHDLYVGNTSEAFAHGNLNAQIALADSGGGRSLKSSAGGAQDIINTPLALSGYGTPRIGTETQPRHQAWLGCIKY